MSRKRSKRKNSRTHAAAARRPSIPDAPVRHQAHPLSALEAAGLFFSPRRYWYLVEHDSRLAWIFFRADAAATAVILGLGTFMAYHHADFSSMAGLPATIASGLLGGATLTRLIHIVLVLLALSLGKLHGNVLRQVIYANFFADVLSSTTIFVLFLYYVGFVSALSGWLASIWPSLAAHTSSTIATVISWSISGIIGNSAFALFKFMLVRIARPRRPATE